MLRAATEGDGSLVVEAERAIQRLTVGCGV
jgi:hypothetical protein